MSNYRLTIGLEIHAELSTRTKMFCNCLNDPNEEHPNINVCPVCMGHPGTLPVANKHAIESVLKVGMALGAIIPTSSKFDRKNYFYPDLPKGYQISQYDMPLVRGGALELKTQNSKLKTIRITRVHLEEDAGSLMHAERKGEGSLVDFNRAGVPLMELVTEPDISSSEEARAAAEELQMIFRYVGASHANMEKGEMRCEANISISKSEKLGTKVEVKNLNSFQSLARAIEYEYERQAKVLDKGEKVVQETRGFDENKGITFSQRLKEEAHDYRYFPEPDLPVLDLKHFDLERLRLEVPELPREKRKRFREEFSLKENDAETIVRDRFMAEYFEESMSEFIAINIENKLLAQLLANYLVNDLANLVKEFDVPIKKILVTPEHFAHLIDFVGKDKISSRIAKDTLRTMMKTGEDPESLIARGGLLQDASHDDLADAVKYVIAGNEKIVAIYKAGKASAIEALVGQVMKETKGKANPKAIKEMLVKELE